MSTLIIERNQGNHYITIIGKYDNATSLDASAYTRRDEVRLSPIDGKPMCTLLEREPWLCYHPIFSFFRVVIAVISLGNGYKLY